MWFGIIGLNGTCLLILLVFVEPPWIPPRSRLKQEPPRARRAPPPSAAIKRISKYASSNRERQWSKKRRAVKRLRAFSVVPLLRPKLRLFFWGETPCGFFRWAKNTASASTLLLLLLASADFFSSNPRIHINEAPPLAEATGRTLKVTFHCSKILRIAQTSTAPNPHEKVFAIDRNFPWIS